VDGVNYNIEIVVLAKDQIIKNRQYYFFIKPVASTMDVVPKHLRTKIISGLGTHTANIYSREERRFDK
jgi:hypothetical protein